MKIRLIIKNEYDILYKLYMAVFTFLKCARISFNL